MGAVAWWRRIDGRALEGVVGLALLLVGLFGVLLPILGVAGPFPPVDSRTVELDGAPTVPGAVAGDGVELHGARSAELAFADPGLGERVLLALPGVTGAILLVVILEQLMRMARTFQDGDVFVARNSRRLTVIAVAVLLFGVLVPLVDALTARALVGGTPVEPAVQIAYEPSALWALVSILLFAAAGAFRHGTRLRADTEGLV
ncbi:DUF2975 domain-containing protein [Actinomadura sp. WMMB 499]|uniref:DUF2975 domain-containing protein n=1 Tax=Actinomadura sp. WMMB 499 TaxID=1219491 RepID=UPI001248A52C|nr:DUF2975 domain-containing protein [Actinomadura sp. WMMB 499]QFG23193.1 DUF2975 domain-containing protein [Actinomadura sp. WMMB 499]